MNGQHVAQALLDHLAPQGEPGGDRIWRFSTKMDAAYLQQMETFNEDKETGQWQRLYSADHMPPPDDTQNMAEVAAQMAFYFPTHFFKFQKAATQHLLEWYSRQAQLNPYPFDTPSITLIDIGAGVGTATLAVVDLLATLAEVFGELGHRQLGVSVRLVAVETDSNKQDSRREMLGAMSSMLDQHSVRIGWVTDIRLPFPQPECLDGIVDAAGAGSFVICCMSNFLSSLDTEQRQTSASVVRAGSQTIEQDDDEEMMQWARSPIAIESAVQCATASRHLLANLPVSDRVLLAAELKQRAGIVRPFANALHPCAELAVCMNHIRFCASRGSYWHSLRSEEQAGDPDWATGFWSLAHWVAGSGRFDGRQ